MQTTKKKSPSRFSARPRVIFTANKEKGFGHLIVVRLLAFTRECLLNMMDVSTNDDPLIIDMGCNIGFLTRPLSFFGETVGLDIDREAVRKGKKYNPNIDFVCCDLCNLPLRDASANIVVCGSVFEHVENLSKAIKEIKLVLKKKGRLVAGYPIETRLLEFVFRFFCKSESQVWNQRNLIGVGHHPTNPHAHKQGFLDIREMLEKNFSPLKLRKIPMNCFPDSLSIYEIITLARSERNDSELCFECATTRKL